MPTHAIVNEISKTFSTKLPERTVTSNGVIIMIADTAGVNLNIIVTWSGAWNVDVSTKVGNPQELATSDRTDPQSDQEFQLRIDDILLCQQALGDCARIMWFSSQDVSDVAKSCMILMKHFQQSRPLWQVIPVWVFRIFG